MQGLPWLNTVLAVPVVGLVTHQRLDFPALVWTLLAKMQPKWGKDGLGAPQIKAISATDVRVERDGGLYIALSPAGVVAGYTFNLNLKSIPGKLPELELPALDSYTELQSKALQAVTDFLEVAFGEEATYPVIRVGVMAQTRLDTADAPPGVQTYLSSLGAALGNVLLSTEGTLLACIAERDDGRDQCHHGCKLNEVDRPGDLDFSLDYQRVWKPMKLMPWRVFRNELESVTRDANAYFEAFGSGERVSNGSGGENS